MPKQDLLDDLPAVARMMDVTFLETTPTGKCVFFIHDNPTNDLGLDAVFSLITPDQAPCIQVICAGGERLSEQVREAWAPVVRMINM